MAEAFFTDQDKLAEIKREIGLRYGVYPKLVASGRMTTAAMERQIKIMDAIAFDYHRRVEEAQATLPLSSPRDLPDPDKVHPMIAVRASLMSIAIRLAAMLEEAAGGEPVAFAAWVWVKGRAQYISNADRETVRGAVGVFIDKWRRGRKDERQSPPQIEPQGDAERI